MTPETQDDLQAVFTREWTAQLGTTVGDGYARKSFLRMLARKLTAHFDLIGWPDTEEGVLIYVRQAIERHA